jgi:hypothetical protein
VELLVQIAWNAHRPYTLDVSLTRAESCTVQDVDDSGVVCRLSHDSGFNRPQNQNDKAYREEPARGLAHE